MKKTFFIIDGSSCLYRAYHAIPKFTTKEGFPTNAVYGFTQTLKKILKTYRPDYITVAFDVKGPTFRHEAFKEYKMERPPMPDDLSLQIPLIKEITAAFNIHGLEKQGYEADDIIATLVRMFAADDIKAVIISGDKDMMQLVRDGGVVILDYVNDKEYGEKEVMEKTLVPAQAITDFIALAGDASDNIPGVKGIGAKTAAKLINKFNCLENLHKNIDKIEPQNLRSLVGGHIDVAVLSKKLAQLDAEVPIECALEDFKIKEIDFERLEGLFKTLEFSKLIKELIPLKKSEGMVNVIRNAEELSIALKGLESPAAIAMTAGDYTKGSPMGFSFGSRGGALYHVEISAERATASCALLEKGLDEGLFIKAVKDLIEDGKIELTTDDAKEMFSYFSKKGFRLSGVKMDVTLASYLLNPHSDHALESIAYDYLGLRGEASDKGFRLTAILGLAPLLESRLKEGGLFNLFMEIEQPLAEVLAWMEGSGIKADKEALRKLSVEMDARINSLEGEIFKKAGYRFNVNSPKQLAHFLFEKLNIKPLKKTKTGHSTDEGVLLALAKNYPIAGDILDVRQTYKLKSTYVDGILALIDDSTGRVHTSFNQTATSTGRLSSSEPNLQNIPVRGRFADSIREAFVAEGKNIFLSADYSQIELRLVAHLSMDERLVEAFKNDEDIHTQTASEVFNVHPALVTPDLRRRAKAINFGIIYGMGPHGLSQELGITVKEAKDYIDAYFTHYKRVRQYMDELIEKTKKHGFAETIFGRRRYIPELKSPSEPVMRAGERMAINTPVQGSAADIIKSAMLKIYRRFAKEGVSTKMLLQIHDELLFEAPEEELHAVETIVKEEMEGVVSLKVPIKVDMMTGKNWREVT